MIGLWSNTTLNSYESLTIFVSPLNLEQVLRSCGEIEKPIREMPRDAEGTDLLKRLSDEVPLPAR